MSYEETPSFGLGHYLLTWVALMALGLLSLGLVFVPLGGWSAALALLIAGIKAVLVALVFMHLLRHGGAIRLAAMSGLGFVVLLATLMVVDVATR